MKTSFSLIPIGWVRKNERSATLEIDSEFTDALLGLEDFSHIVVLYWFHENDNPDSRNTLRVHPRGNPKNPLTGVFATHSPVRPNLIATTTCRIESIEGNRITIDKIDARNGTPIIDIKSYFPSKRQFSGLRVPEWIK